MEGIVLTGKLIYIDTEKSEIMVLEHSIITDLFLDPQIEMSPELAWETLLGKQVEVVVINDKVKSISLTG